MTDAVIQFRDALQAAFSSLDWLPIGDGLIHRFHVPGDRKGSTNGWYVLYLDGIASGAFGSWKHGQSGTWSSCQPSNPMEAEQVRQRIEQAQQQRKAEREASYRRAAHKAQSLWKRAKPANPEHPYLKAKGAIPHALRQLGQMLLVPIYWQGQLVNLQRIELERKRFLFEARITGGYSPIGRLMEGQPLYLCEGWATGATLHQATGCPVACAMHAGNLLPAGQQLRQRHPERALIVAGDDDRQTPGNPGRTAALAAAKALGASVVMPDWPADAPNTLTDFNDLALWLAGGRIHA